MNTTVEKPETRYGVVAEFATPEAAARAARLAREKGFRHLDAFGPFSSPELTEAIGFREHKIARCVLGGGIAGGILGYALQYYCTVLDYPHNVGGRPFDSWPSFIPVTFETTVLGAAVTGIISLLVIARLPRLSHPVFSAENFQRASTDRFFLCLKAEDDPDFSFEAASELLGSCAPLSISILEKDPP
jgi:hypothetical protein